MPKGMDSGQRLPHEHTKMAGTDFSSIGFAYGERCGTVRESAASLVPLERSCPAPLNPVDAVSRGLKPANGEAVALPNRLAEPAKCC